MSLIDFAEQLVMLISETFSSIGNFFLTLLVLLGFIVIGYKIAESISILV